MKWPVRHVLWDWNGTLLDDVDCCVGILNVLCERRRMGPVEREDYLRKFTFPVIEYYRELGFDPARESFEEAAREWVDLYTERLPGEAQLHDGVPEVLEAVRERGIGQSVLSAHHRGMLVAAVERYGLAEFFDAVLGIEDHYAESKVAIGRQWLEGAGFNPREVLLVGDTLHDWEVAEAMGIRCLLVASGHQERSRLESSGAVVVGDLRDTLDWL